MLAAARRPVAFLFAIKRHRDAWLASRPARRVERNQRRCVVLVVILIVFPLVALLLLFRRHLAHGVKAFLKDPTRIKVLGVVVTLDLAVMAAHRGACFLVFAIFLVFLIFLVVVVVLVVRFLLFLILTETGFSSTGITAPGKEEVVAVASANLIVNC